MSGPAVPVKGLCFDKDGTLFDFAATWEAWAEQFLRRAAQGDEALATRMGDAIGYDFAAGTFESGSLVIAGTAGEIADVLAQEFRDVGRDELLRMIDAEAAAAPQQQAVPLVPLLEGLRASGLALGVATNDSEAPARAHLASAGVTSLFDFIAGYDSGHGAKPGPGQLLAFADAVALPPAQIVMVGDSTHDLRAGRAAGMRTIAVLTGAATAEVLAPLADVVLRDIGEIPEWLEAQSAQ